MDSPQLGIIGGGQLALYLTQSAQKLGVKVALICDSDLEPAAAVADTLYLGKAAEVLAKHPELAQETIWTFENEFLDVRGLDTLETYPRLSVLNTLRNKRRQKTFVESLGVPTSEWIARDANESVDDFWMRSQAVFGPGEFVLKWAEGGYDGHGTWISKLGAPMPAEFFAKTPDIFAERKIRFDFECALVAVRDRTGKTVSYPVVQSEQDAGICRSVRGPATEFGLSQALQTQAQAHIGRMLEELDYVGCMAVEFFYADGQLLVNEIAPRVHNTAHYSMDASNVSQFENHVRSVMNLGVQAPRSDARFAMVNILGPDATSTYSVEDDFALPPSPHPQISSHWYGKRQIKSRRKLGHVNLSCSDPKNFAELAPVLEQYVAQIERLLAAGPRNTP